MSTQAGIWNFDGRPVDRKLISDFSSLLQHQAPDGENTHIDGSIVLLFRPFHTTAESRREKQPYVSRRGFVLTWDGRLDNRRELIADLRDDLEKVPTDAAIVAAGFDRWETTLFQRIVGDWAVSIWRPAQRELLFATDFMGMRHIFYYPKENRIWWSTELSPLVLLSGDKFELDHDYIASYFANNPHAHLSPYREIGAVPPGHFLRITQGHASVERFWRFSADSRIRYKRDADYERHFLFVFRQSVRRRLRSDSPVLAELSGGIDSSSIVCVADDIIATEAQPNPRLDTLSYHDKTEPNGDDWIFFPKIENFRGRIGHHIDARPSLRGNHSLKHPEFSAFPGCLGYARNVEAERATIVARGGYRVVLSGIGGDEFMGGIPNPSPLLGDLICQCRFVALARQLAAWSLVKRRPWIQLLGEAVTDLLPPSLAQHLAKRVNIPPWIKKHFAKRTKLAVRLLDIDEHFGLWLPSRRCLIAGVLVMAAKQSQSCSSGLAPEEVRHPYLDEDLIRFVLSIPASQLLRPGERRSLMTRSLAGIVPQEVLSRRTKQLGVRTPILALERSSEELRELLESPQTHDFEFVDQARLVAALNEAKFGKAAHTVLLLKTLSLEFWLRDMASRHLLKAAASRDDIVARSN